jgi:Ca-activated chloride channel family protein
MQTPSFDPNDPRLTAFAFGELNGSDKEAMEELLAESEEAREALKNIEQTVALVREELIAEPSAGLTSAQRAAIRDAAAATTARSPIVKSNDGAVSGSPKRSMIAIGASLATTAVVVIAVVIAQRSGDSPESTDVAASAVMADQDTQIVAADVALAQEGKDGEFGDENAMGLPAGFGSGSNNVAGRSAAPDPKDEGDYKKAADVADNSEFKSEVNRSRVFNRKLNKRKKDVAGVANLIPKFGNDDDDQGKALTVADQPQADGKNDRVAASSRDKRKYAEDSKSLAGDAKPSAPGPKAIPSRNGQQQVQRSLPGGSQAGEKQRGGKLGPKAKETSGKRGNSNAGASPDGYKRKDGRLGDGGSPKPQSAPNQSPESGSGLAAITKKNNFRKQPGGLYRISEGDKEAPTSDPYQANKRANPTNEDFDAIVENDFIVPKLNDALSTFSIDVDTASYANVRRFLNRDQLPPKNAVRIEELINYFKYDYKQPQGEAPFSVDIELAQCPWATDHRLARIALQAKTIAKDKRPRTNLVFLIDESGSMRANNKLPLVKTAMKILIDELTEDDQVSIVTYSSTIKVRLDVTSGAKKNQIRSVIDRLSAGGSTNGSGGIQKAYDVANKHFLQDSSNRVILCTDGDFNVGISKDDELVAFIKEKAASGVFLSVFGFGMGNLKDGKLEKLADNGNGQYGYIDSEKEARKVFQDQLMGTLYTVAKDVKLQVDFNHNLVGAYRLIGYENRKLEAQDFNDDTKDAGEIGAGHCVTALYEIVPVDVWAKRPQIKSGSKYQQDAKKDKKASDEKYADELFTVKLSYKKPDEEKSKKTLDYVVKDIDLKKKLRPSDDFMFAAAVASFGMNLRESRHKGSWNLMEVQETAEGTVGEDPSGIRREFVELVKTARRLTEPVPKLTRPKRQAFVGTPKALPADEARNKATVNGKYRRLLKKITVKEDAKDFGEFYDYGKWDYTSYAGHTELPKGHWVYAYPNWYIWAEQVAPKE